jgi:putative nucleotidyltransferase with HDIG domain
MLDEAENVRLVSGERIGGGLQADGTGELSKLLLGARPAKALRLARDSGVLVAIVPEFARAIDYDTQSKRQGATLDEHIFAVVQGAPASLPVRLAALFHDLGKPEADETAEKHALVGARIAGDVLARLRYPTRLRRYVVDLVAAHAFRLDDVDELFARRFLREHGDVLAHELVAHKEADLRAKNVAEWELEAVARLGTLLEQEAAQPHRLADLEVDGSDLLALGYREGPQLGAVLSDLLDEVVEDPSRNRKEWLLERARERLA